MLPQALSYLVKHGEWSRPSPAGQQEQPFLQVVVHLHQRSPLDVIHSVVGLPGLVATVEFGGGKAISLLELSQVGLQLAQLCVAYVSLVGQ